MRRIVVDARAFSDAMAKVSRVLKKSPLPILGEICVSVRDGICTLTATDLETWITARLPVQGDDLTFVFNRTKDVMKALAHMNLLSGLKTARSRRSYVFTVLNAWRNMKSVPSRITPKW